MRAIRWVEKGTGALFGCLSMLSGLVLYLVIALLEVPLPRLLPWALVMGALLVLGAVGWPPPRHLGDTNAGMLLELPEQLEEILLRSLWVLALGIAVLTALSGDDAVAPPIATAFFLGAFSVHWAVSLSRPGRFASTTFRLAAHYAFAAVGLAILLATPGPVGYFLVAPLTAALALSRTAMGTRETRIIASLAALILITGNFVQWLSNPNTLELALGEVLLKVTVLAATVEVGLRISALRDRVLQDLRQARQQGEQRIRYLSLINRITLMVNGTLDPTELLRTASAELPAALEAHGAVILLTSGEADATPRFLTRQLEPTHPLIIAAAESLQGSAAAVEDLTSEASPSLLPDALRKGLLDVGARAALLAPIQGTDGLLGAALLLHQSPRAWTAEEFLLLEGVAAGLAVGIQKAEIHQKLVRSNHDLQIAQEQLQAQNEELQAQNELLQTQQEELEQQRCQLEQALEAAHLSEERFRSAFMYAPIGMALVGTDDRLVQVNPALCHMLGYTEEELIGRTYRDITHPDDIARTAEQYRLLQSGKVDYFTLEKRYFHKNGHEVWALLSGSTIRDGGKTEVARIVQVVDITDRKRYEETLLHLARFDPLTAVLNRRGFQVEVERLISDPETQKSEAALLYLDLDEFKFVNDNMGHHAGDQLLRSLAQVMRSHLREGDVLGRLGGDEFAVFLPGTSPEEAQEIARRLQEAIRSHVEIIGDYRLSTSASIGLAFYPRDGRHLQELLTRADLAMYMAKDTGRDRLCIADPDNPDQERMVSRLYWEQQIRAALEENRLILFWQPIRNLRNDQTQQYELLLRMVDEQGRIIPPSAFLETAERFGSIHAIDRWVVQQAILLLQNFQRQGKDISLEVNLSARAFEDVHLLTLIRDQIAITGIDPQHLILEITETAAIRDIDAASRFIETLRGLGCRFAIDDFGTGFASLYYVKRLPVDYLKIDGAFVTNLPRDPVDRHLVRAMVDVARGLGKQTVAEFVQDEETVRVLRELGVDYAQGYHIGKPRPLEEGDTFPSP